MLFDKRSIILYSLLPNPTAATPFIDIYHFL